MRSKRTSERCLGLDQSTGELDAVVSEHLVGDAIGAHGLGEGQADLASGGPAHHLGQHAKARMVVDPGHHLALGAIGEEDPRDDVVLPQLHRDVALPAHIGVPPALAGDGGDQVVAHEHPIDGGSRRHGGDPLLGQPIDQGPRSIAGVLDGAARRWPLRAWARGAGWPLGLWLRSISAPIPSLRYRLTQAMHALAGHPITLGHLGDRDLGLENLHDCLVALLHDAQLHQHRSATPSVNQSDGQSPVRQKCQASSGARVSSIKRNPAQPQSKKSGLFCTASSRPSPRTAASPPPRPGGRGLRPLLTNDSERRIPIRSEAAHIASRPAAERPATSIVGTLRGVLTQPSRVRSAGLRPPLTAACQRCRP